MKVDNTTLTCPARPAGINPQRVIRRPAWASISPTNPLCMLMVENPHLPALRREILDIAKKFNPDRDLTVIDQAIDLANRTHSAEIFVDGEPVIYHLGRIAKQLAEWRLSPEAIAAGILLRAPNAAINELNCPAVRELIGKKDILQSYKFNVNLVGHRKKFMKFALMKEKDPLVHLLVAAEEYQALLKGVDEANEIAARSFYVTAPLLMSVGLNEVGREIENLAFFCLNPAEARRAQNIFHETTAMERWRAAEELKIICAEVGSHLLADGLKAQIIPDTKMEASLSQKKESGEKLTDLLRFRILVETEADCRTACECARRVLAGDKKSGEIGLGFNEDKKDFKDFIREPKANGYRSLHLHFIDRITGCYLAVQVRTYRMHQDAEYGQASHWRYKQRERFGKLPDFSITPQAVAENIVHFRASLEAEGRTYAFDQSGDLKRMVQTSTMPISFWDLAIHGDLKDGPYAPNFVEVERVSENGERVKLRLPRSSIVQNGDRLLPFREASKKLGNPDNLGTLLASTIVKQIKMGSRMEASDIHEIEEQGEKLCDLACEKVLAELMTLAQSFIEGEDIAVLYSKERLAKKLGLRSVDEMYYSFALRKGEEKKQLISKGEEIIRNSFIAINYDPAKYEIRILARDRRGVLIALSRILEKQKVEVKELQAKLIENEQVGIIRLQLSGPLVDREKLLGSLREIYREVSDLRTTYDRTRRILLSFHLKQCLSEHIFEAVARILEADCTIDEVQVTQVSDNPANLKGRALITLKLPAGHNLKATDKKIKRALKRSPVITNIRTQEKIELLP